ncbi:MULTISPECIES: 50S ribosomal protein L32 [unclassified Helicobacter]|nr:MULTISPECIES: 50S ribosomal protein L32 [unclassified Helicobacter]
MAVPKRRVSKTRAAKRRTHYKVTLAVPVRDKDGTWKIPHHRNKFNGTYK